MALGLKDTRDRSEHYHQSDTMEELTPDQALEDSVRQAQKLAEKANRANEAKNERLANISHEMRTPLNGILGLADTLAGDSLTEVQRLRVDVIRDCGRNLLTLINDILDASKIEAGTLAIRIGDCCLGRILNSTESMLRTEAQNKGIEFEIIEGIGLPATIRTDPMRVQQCLLNLVGNAIKFTSQGHVHVTVSLDEIAEEPAIRFDVEDTGIGIPAEQQQAIFEPFTQAAGDTTGKLSGTGLGLTITRELVELVQGELTLTSEVGKGSVFSLVIPAGLDVSQQPSLNRHSLPLEPEELLPVSDTVTFSGKVLVAEDVETNQMVIQAMLGQLGLEVTLVPDGNQVVQQVREDSFDLIFMDINMPGMDGLAATRLLRKENVKVPIIALTAFAMEGDEQRCLEAGCDGHLCKPIERSKMFELVSKYLPARSDVTVDAVPSIDAKIPEPDPVGDDASSSVSEQESDTGVINWQSLIDRLRDEELIKDVLPVYLKDNEEHFKELTEALQSQDLGSVASRAHAICGAGRNLGALALTDIAHQMEIAGRKNDIEETKRLFPRFKKEIEKVLTFMSQPDWMDIAKQQAAASHQA